MEKDIFSENFARKYYLGVVVTSRNIRGHALKAIKKAPYFDFIGLCTHTFSNSLVKPISVSFSLLLILFLFENEKESA